MPRARMYSCNCLFYVEIGSCFKDVFCFVFPILWIVTISRRSCKRNLCILKTHLIAIQTHISCLLPFDVWCETAYFRTLLWIIDTQCQSTNKQTVRMNNSKIIWLNKNIFVHTTNTYPTLSSKQANKSIGFGCGSQYENASVAA